MSRVNMVARVKMTSISTRVSVFWATLVIHARSVSVFRSFVFRNISNLKQFRYSLAG